MEEGMLPNFSRLKKLGSYNRLQTTFPSESPVAWSSFQTGSNPGRHRIFDFFVPNRKNYLPELASAEIGPPLRKISFGKYAIPLGKPRLMLKRKSQAFWKVLSDYGIFSTILRVPITFPPEKFKGLLLASMSVPDLCGTQGTFSYYTSDPEELARHCMEDADPEFAGKVSTSDIIVAGKYFGCGSSREHAPIAIKAVGISCVIAKSYARIFYRNSVDGGFVIPYESENILKNEISTGDELELNVENNLLKNFSTGKEYNLKPLGEVLPIINAGGLFNYARTSGMI